jgi:hypothetical protein
MASSKRDRLTVPKSRRLKTGKLISGRKTISENLSYINRSSIFFIGFTLFFLFFVLKINLNFRRDWPVERQIRNLNVDAKLYFHLAQNIVNGTGYYVKFRNDEAMPSVGHPLLLAIFCIILKMPPATFAWFFFVVSFLLLSAAVWIYSRSNILLILAMWLFCGFFKHIEWLSGNVESSIVFANMLLAASLAVFYKTGFSQQWAIVSGCSLFVHILMRPIFLFPTHLCLVVCIVVILYHYVRKYSLPLGKFVKGWFILLIIAESLVLMTYAYSYLRYQDSRLASGTYGATVLYAGNNIYLPTNRVFWVGSKHHPEFLKKIQILQDTLGMTWQQRHKILMHEVVNYWKQHPVRAIQGWWWRFGNFISIYSVKEESPRTLHIISVWVLLILVIIRVLIRILHKEEKLELKNSFGLVCSSLFFAYSAIHAVFCYSGFRFAAVTLVLLTLAVVCLLYEIKPLLGKAAATILAGSH